MCFSSDWGGSIGSEGAWGFEEKKEATKFLHNAKVC
jgi:hypothetical protein